MEVEYQVLHILFHDKENTPRDNGGDFGTSAAASDGCSSATFGMSAFAHGA